MTLPAWPAYLPQELDRRGFREAMPDIQRSSADGPEKRRRRSTATPYPLSGQMLMNGQQWQILKYFFDFELQGGVLSFDFPDPDRDDGAAETIRVSFDQPPSRTNPGGDNYWVRLRFLVQPGG